jgi:hypothetical protein
MGWKCLFCAAIVALCVTQAHAQTTIDFATLPECTPVTNQYAGVTFSLSGGNDSSGPPEISVYGIGLSNSTNCGEYPTAASLVADFAGPTSGVTFTFDDQGYNGGNEYYVYDTSDNLLADGPLNSDDQVVGLGYTDIGSIVWFNGLPASNGDNWQQGLSDLTYSTSVTPEPSSYVLFSTGVLGIIGITRRRKRLA